MVQVHSNKTKQPFLLKGLSLEDNAVLGQFCAEVILLSAIAHTQNAPPQQKALTLIFLFSDF